MYQLQTKNVVKEYAQFRALDDVSIDIPKGSIFGLLGPNGAGKTSLIRIINQITGPDSGEVYFEGKPLSAKNIPQIGYLPEERGLYRKMKVGEQLLYLAQLKGLSKAQATEKLQIWFDKFEMRPWWSKQVSDLSKGMQQKVQFVSTVLHEPQLIILDEPFSGFDPINANLIRDEILELKEKGATIIFSTHRMDTVEELCDYIVLLNRAKKVLEGPKEEIRKRFKTNTFYVDYLGELNGKFEARQVPSPLEGLKRAEIILPNESAANGLLGELIQQVEVRGFGENIPTMNQIFVSVVKKDGHDA